MSALPSILCCLVIFQIVPQLLCDDTTIIPTDSSNNSTDLLSASTKDVKASPTNIPLLSSPGAAASPSLPPLPTVHPPNATIKPTRAPAVAAAAPGGGASGSSPSTQPPLIHQPAAESLPPANQTTKFSMPAENNSTKTDKNSANSIYSHGYLSFVVLLLVGAIF